MSIPGVLTGPAGSLDVVGDPDDVLVAPGDVIVSGGASSSDAVVIADSGGDLVGGAYQPLVGYVGIPSPYTDVVDPDDSLVAPDGTFVSELILSRPNLIAGLLPFIVVEIEAARPTVAVDYSLGWGAAPYGALSMEASLLEETITLRVSDLGYRTESPVSVYEPLLAGGMTIDARVPLSPAQDGIVFGFGTVSLINEGSRYNGLMSAWNIDGRTVTIKYGVKTWDDTTGIFLDPVSDDLITLFTGVAGGWVLSEFLLTITLRDASYWMDRPLQRSAYAGTGTYEGDAELAGTPKPKTRGKAFNVPLTLIDRDNLIYQYNDGPGTVVALYEGAATTITFGSNTTDLYTGSTTPGTYRTDNSRGLIQLGLEPADNTALTATVIGHFPTAGEQLIAANIVRYLISEDMALPSALLNTASFTAAATDYPYEAGWYWGPDAQVAGDVAVGQCLAAFGAKIAPSVDGSLHCIIMKAVTDDESPTSEYTTASIIECNPRAMPTDISPPAYRFRARYQHNYTVQQSGILESADAAHRQFVQQPDRYAAWYSAETAGAYANANDVAPFGGGLTTEADALEVATRYGALFGTRRWLFDVQVPLVEAVERQFGEVVLITYPNHAMLTGARGRVVGRSLDTQQLSLILTVLV